MACRRCLRSITQQAGALLFAKTTPPLLTPTSLQFLSPIPQSRKLTPNQVTSWSTFLFHSRRFSSNRSDESENEVEREESSEDTATDLRGEYSPEEKAAETAAIGYKVIGSLQQSERVFKPFEPVFAVVQIGSHQFKVSNGDCIFTERLKFCEVNDKLILNKVLLMGSTTQTIIGRPVVPDAAVHAVVEEHALDSKVIIFKKKRRKNYRRTKGHRQELTKLRITDIQGIEKPETKAHGKPLKATKIKPEKIAVAA